MVNSTYGTSFITRPTLAIKERVWKSRPLNMPLKIFKTLSLRLLDQPIVHWDEGEIIKYTTLGKKFVLGMDDKVAQNEFLFINTSYDLQLIDRFDEYGFPNGNQVITDRTKLATLFQKFNEADAHKYLFVDIFFKDPSPYDEELRKAIEKTPRMLASNHMTEEGDVVDTILFDIKFGISDYAASAGFTKFKFFNDQGLRSTPLALYEEIHNKKMEKGKYFMRDSNHTFFNTAVIDMKIRPYYLFEAAEHYPYANIGDMLYLDSASFRELVENKLVVIGDFKEHDMHETVFGDTPGPLILANAYLNLRAKDNVITWPFVLFVFLGYYLISWIMFTPKDFLISRVSTYSSNALLVQSLSFMSLVFVIFLHSLLGYIIFNIQLSFLFIAIYAKVGDWVFEKVGEDLTAEEIHGS